MGKMIKNNSTWKGLWKNLFKHCYRYTLFVLQEFGCMWV